MRLYLISQNENNNYDTYDAFVVAANNSKNARRIVSLSSSGGYGCWAYSYDAVKVEYLGTAKPGTKCGKILGSFNAG